jgi:hypothetical protein
MRIRSFITFVSSFGLNPKNIVLSLLCLPSYVIDLFKFVRVNTFGPVRLLPVLTDKYQSAGDTNSIYFIQDLHVARIVKDHIDKNNDTLKVGDLGSRIDGYILALLCFTEVHFLDVRPLSNLPKGLIYQKIDATDKGASFPFKFDILTSLHALEHFGLGRYGDELSNTAWLDGLSVLRYGLADDGLLIISVPISDQQRVEFNAHRIFEPKTILDELPALNLKLERFDIITDERHIVTNVDITARHALDYGVGIFHMRAI